MKLEVGMYVRTKKRTLQCPQIARIRNISKDTGYKNQYYIELDKNLIPSYEYHIYKEDILKASHNIIDLLEVGDYVNGEKVIRIYEKGECYDGSNYGLITKTIETENDNYETIPHNHLYVGYSIKSIVTKEQFKSMQYKVGE